MSTDRQETDQPATSHRKYLNVAIIDLKVDMQRKIRGVRKETVNQLKFCLISDYVEKSYLPELKKCVLQNHNIFA